MTCISSVSFYSPNAKKGLNKEQILILRKAADDLNFKIQNIKAQSSKMFNTPYSKEIINGLRDSLFESTKEVKRIQGAFTSVSTNPQLCAFNRIFFNDILDRYDEGQDSLINYGKNSYEVEKSYIKVISTLEYTYKAYSVVAEEGQPKFDLVVISVPNGATIYYRKKGDTQDGQKTTNATIKNLDYCTWYFKIHLKGYIDEEKPFNPYDASEKVLDFGQLKQIK